MIRHGTSFGARAPFDPEIRSTEGVPNLLEAIGVAVKTYDRLGIVVDADEHPAARWAVRGRLVGMNPLDVLPADGFVGAGIHPDTRVGVWMTPDNAARGMRETFLATLVPPGDAAWRYAAEVVAEARARGARCGSTDKPRMSTWLAWQDPEGRPLGLPPAGRWVTSRRSPRSSRPFSPRADRRGGAVRVCRHVGSWLEPVQEPGKPRRTPAVIVRVAHLDDDECAVVLGVVLEDVLAWCLTTTIPARRLGDRRFRKAAHTAPARARTGRLFGSP